MTLLLDTHSFLWFVLNDASLSVSARSLISDPRNDVLISPATYWEIANKVSIGKYQLPGSFAASMDDQIARNDLTIPPITVGHAAVVASLPFHHKNPFDRLLIAQAIVENISVLSVDAAFDAYPVSRLW